MKPLWPIFLGLFLIAPSGELAAETYKVTQGDLLTIHTKAAEGTITLTCFGKQWPVKRERDGTIWAWVGVDLKTAPETYPLKWRIGDRDIRDTLVVSKGKFRISRITVKKKMAVFGPEEIEQIRADQRTLKDSYKAHVDASPFIHITQMPVEGIESTPFGAQRYVNGEARSPHSGIDIAAPEGTPVITPLAGRVLVSESMYLNGNTVVIGHGNGLVSIYCHLKQLRVKQNEWIDKGKVLGEVGMTGRSTGPHLHWGLRFRNARINPHSVFRLQQEETTP